MKDTAVLALRRALEMLRPQDPDAAAELEELERRLTPRLNEPLRSRARGLRIGIACSSVWRQLSLPASQLESVPPPQRAARRAVNETPDASV